MAKFSTKAITVLLLITGRRTSGGSAMLTGRKSGSISRIIPPGRAGHQVHHSSLSVGDMMQHGAGRHQVKVTGPTGPARISAWRNSSPGTPPRPATSRDPPRPPVRPARSVRPATPTPSRYRSQLRASAFPARHPAAPGDGGAPNRATATSAPAAGARLRGDDQGRTLTRCSRQAPAKRFPASRS